MHTARTAHETLEFLWNNYLALCEQVDLDSMLERPEFFETGIAWESRIW